MLNEAPEVRAIKLMDEFVSAMIRIAPKAERTFTVTDRDGDQVSFDLDNYPFTLSWGEVQKLSIGRTVPVVEFQLCIWHRTMGSRINPPEDIDTTLIDSQSIYDCIRTVFETVAKEEIRIIVENDGYDQMAKESQESI